MLECNYYFFIIIREIIISRIIINGGILHVDKFSKYNFKKIEGICL